MNSLVKHSLLVAALLSSVDALAEVLNSNTPFIRIRIGDNTVGSVNTVIYNAGIPAAFIGVPGVVAEPTEVSTNNIAGASGVFRVRLVTDLNLRPPLSNPPNNATSLSGTFSYDSSSPMVCTTPATCGSTSIAMSKISWTARDNDTQTMVLQYDDSAFQLLQVQTDTNPAVNATETRHRNYFQFRYNNDTLLPAGTYQGQIRVNGEGAF